MKEFKYDIEKHVGVISESQSGWTKELNLISWNDRIAKFDLREWDSDHQKMGKGLTFTKEEMSVLRELLNNLDLED